MWEYHDSQTPEKSTQQFVSVKFIGVRKNSTQIKITDKLCNSP
jgi:hypothetical protein